MSHVPLEYFTGGLGACEVFPQYNERYAATNPYSTTPAQLPQYLDWQCRQQRHSAALREKAAAYVVQRQAPASTEPSAQVQAEKIRADQAAAEASIEASQQVPLPVYTIPKREPFGFQSRLQPISFPTFSSGPATFQPFALATDRGRIPTWVIVAGSLLVFAGLAAYVKKVRG